MAVPCALCREIYIKGGSVEGFIAHYNKDHTGRPLPTNCHFDVHQCHLCQLVTKTRRGLSRHLGSKHGSPSRQISAHRPNSDLAPSLFQSQGGTYTVCLDQPRASTPARSKHPQVKLSTARPAPLADAVSPTPMGRHTASAAKHPKPRPFKYKLVRDPSASTAATQTRFPTTFWRRDRPALGARTS